MTIVQHCWSVLVVWILRLYPSRLHFCTDTSQPSSTIAHRSETNQGGISYLGGRNDMLYVNAGVAPAVKEYEVYELPQQKNGRPLPDTPKRKKWLITVYASCQSSLSRLARLLCVLNDCTDCCVFMNHDNSSNSFQVNFESYACCGWRSFSLVRLWALGENALVNKIIAKNYSILFTPKLTDDIYHKKLREYSECGYYKTAKINPWIAMRGKLLVFR